MQCEMVPVPDMGKPLFLSTLTKLPPSAFDVSTVQLVLEVMWKEIRFLFWIYSILYSVGYSLFWAFAWYETIPGRDEDLHRIRAWASLLIIAFLIKKSFNHLAA